MPKVYQAPSDPRFFEIHSRATPQKIHRYLSGRHGQYPDPQQANNQHQLHRHSPPSATPAKASCCSRGRFRTKPSVWRSARSRRSSPRTTTARSRRSPGGSRSGPRPPSRSSPGRARPSATASRPSASASNGREARHDQDHRGESADERRW